MSDKIKVNTYKVYYEVTACGNYEIKATNGLNARLIAAEFIGRKYTFDNIENIDSKFMKIEEVEHG